MNLGLKTNISPTEIAQSKKTEEKTAFEEDIKKIANTDILRTKAKKRRKSNAYQKNAKIKTKKPSLFSLSDFVPGKKSKPLMYGLNSIKSKLNYEFGEKTNIHPKATTPNFNIKHPNKMSIVGNISVGEEVLVNTSRNILIATTWRSGSTFLGDLLNHYRGTFYYFEPLHYYSKVMDHSELQEETRFLKSLYSCRFNHENAGFLHHAAQPDNKFLFQNHNFRLWNSCHNLLPNNVMCFMPDYLNHACPLHPIRLIKTVRLRVAKVEKLLQELDLNLKVIFLVRDPRGVYNSRSTGAIKNWCKKDMCADPTVGCQDLDDDINSAFDLETRYPGSVKLVRYEDLSLYPETTTLDMLNFLDLPFTEEISTYIDTHTTREKLRVIKNKKTHQLQRKKNPYGTAKNSSATAFAWREKLSFSKTMNIQESCHIPMKKLGYQLLLNEKMMHSEDLPIEKDAYEVWPFTNDV